MEYSELLGKVEDRGRVSTTEEARAAIEAVLRTAVSLLPPAASHVIYESVPESLKPVAGATRAHGSSDVEELITAVANEASCPPERARYLVQATFHTLSDHDPKIRNALAGHWPAELLHSPGASTPPGPHSTAAYGGPGLVNDQDVGKWLAAHPDWSGDTRRLHRTVSVPRDRMPPLLNALNEAQQRVNHSGSLTETDDGAVFSVSTQSVDSVTESDLELAAAIDELVETVSSGG